MIASSLESSALFLDFDGTLVDIAPAPDLVQVPPDLVPLIARLSSLLQGAVAIISGRPIAEIDAFLDPLRPVAAGVHGAELRTQGNGNVFGTARPIDPKVANAVRALGELAPGIIIEAKMYSIAVHYRLAASIEPQIEAVLKGIVAGSADHFVLSPGRCVMEVVPRQVTKGTALDTLLQLPAFKGRIPIMIGDDIPDESALSAAVKHGGYGLSVAGEHFGDRADFAGPADVRGWLKLMADRLEAGSGVDPVSLTSRADH